MEKTTLITQINQLVCANHYLSTYKKFLVSGTAAGCIRTVSSGILVILSTAMFIIAQTESESYAIALESDSKTIKLES